MVASYSCGLGPALEVIGGKWKAAILWELRARPRRYGTLKRSISGISEKMLIQQLRELEAHGLVDRTVHEHIPPRVDYALTEWGAKLNAALGPIANWGEAYARATGRYPGSEIDARIPEVGE
jgi:DNA-binding HxlR family transcriptional regulator